MYNKAKNIKKRIRHFIILSIIIYLGIEVICYLFIVSGYIPAQLPSFKFHKTVTEYPLQVADIDSIWGTWHYMGIQTFQRSCFNITYSINSYGARDAERLKKSPSTNRVVVLGDSFMEGFGVNAENRVSNILEKKLSREFLNFACSDFGLTQEYLIYKNLASTFAHSTVLIGFLPFNDFKNDDSASSGLETYKRYRPYFTKDNNQYKLIYKEQTLAQSTLTKESFYKTENTFHKKIIRFAKAYTVWANIASYIRYKKITEKEQNKFSYYYHYSKAEIDRLYYIVREIKKSAQNKKIILLVIPTEEDVEIFREKGESKLGQELSIFCSAENIELIDMLPFISKQQTNLYLSCDGHWNESGNTIVADFLEQKIK